MVRFSAGQPVQEKTRTGLFDYSDLYFAPLCRRAGDRRVDFESNPRIHYAFGNPILVWLSLLGFLLLAFFTVDAVRLCLEFIEKISAGPTRYSAATRRHFSRQKGGIDVEYLDEWIDLQLIAELTEQVGRLVYYPAGLVLHAHPCAQ